MLFKLSNLNSNLALTLGYLNPALNNSAQGLKITEEKVLPYNDIYKRLDFLVFSDKVPSHSTFTDLFLWNVKKPTPLFEKSRGRRPRWCSQPLLGWVGYL